MIRLALIGLGAWGKNYLTTAKQISGMQITHLCAQTPMTLQAFPDTYRKTTRYQDFLKEEGTIDGVIIATPPATHFEIARDFIQRRIPVLIEKPVVVSCPQGRRLAELVRTSESIVMAGHIFTYHGAFQKLLELSKGIGRIKFVMTEGCDFGPFRRDISALWDWLPHDVSLCLKLFESEPLEVTAWGVEVLRCLKPQSDMVFLRLVFASQTPAFIKIGRVSVQKKRNFQVIGTNGSLVFDDMQPQKLLYMKHPHLQGKDGEMKDCLTAAYPKFSSAMPLLNQLQEFVRRIKNKNPVTDMVDISRTTKIIAAAQESLSLGKTIRVK